MRDYGKIHSSFWSSQTIRTMKEDARMLAAYLLTCPHGTICGAFRLPNGYICDDMQWTTERVVEGLAELLAKGFANRCETTQWVWIRKHYLWNKLENPNQVKSAQKIALSIPDECVWKQDYMRDSAEVLKLDIKPLPKGSETVTPTVPEPVTVTVTGAIAVAVPETVTATTPAEGEKNIASLPSGDGGGGVDNGGGDVLFSELSAKVITALRDEVNVLDTNDKNPDFLELIALGLTVQDFLDAANSVNESTKRRFNYVLKVARTRYEAKTKSPSVKVKAKSDKGWVPEINVGANGKIS